MVEVPPQPTRRQSDYNHYSKPVSLYTHVSIAVKLNCLDMNYKLGNDSVIPPYVIILWLFVIQSCGNINEWSGWWRVAYADEYNFIYAPVVTSVYCCSLCNSSRHTGRQIELQCALSSLTSRVIHYITCHETTYIIEQNVFVATDISNIWFRWHPILFNAGMTSFNRMLLCWISMFSEEWPSMGSYCQQLI